MARTARNKLYFRWAVLETLLIAVLVSSGCRPFLDISPVKSGKFQGERAFQDVETQLGFGPRYPGTEGHRQVQRWIQQELEEAGWTVAVQDGIQDGQQVRNLIAIRDHAPGYLLLGAHYDTREFADQDPDPGDEQEPVPGANDGASGVAVLLELARVMPAGDLPPVRLVFFDAEDGGRIQGQDWILGSRYYAETMEEAPDAVVILDMIGDRDLNIYREKTSTDWLVDQIWTAARDLGHEEIFINQEKYSILDDHTPFLEAGVPAVDVIDFDYPYWHTTEDSLDKVSAESLQVIGETILSWLERYQALD